MTQNKTNSSGSVEPCARCASTSGARIMSKFNTDMICMDCKDREKAHALYPAADKAELEAVQRGDYNFPGVGCPADLYQIATPPAANAGQGAA